MKIRSTEFRVTGLNGHTIVKAERLGWFEGMEGNDDQWKLEFQVPTALAGFNNSEKPYKVWRVEGEAEAKKAAALIGAEIEEWTIPSKGASIV